MTQNYVKNIDLSLSGTLTKDLIDQGFEISKPLHTIFSAKKKGIVCTLYTTGKLVVQGSDSDDFIRFYLEPNIIKEFTHDYQTTMIDETRRIGIDESGKGDFFGPLCIAGVCAGGDEIIRLQKAGVKDSKLISDEQILILSQKIKDICPYHIVKINPEKYNEIYDSFKNLNTLLGWGHATAIENLALETGCKKVIIDQFASEHVVKNALKRKNLNLELNQKHRGEEDPVVAAASILARATFLYGLKELSVKAEIDLPKGASNKVISAGKKLVKKYGSDAIKKFGKTHFKTLDLIMKD